MIDLARAMEQMLPTVIAVGELQKKNLGRTDLIANTKSTTIDLVTEIDKKSEEMIVAAIHQYFPDHAILAEESGLATKDSDYLWVIDPLDGTTNYTQGLPVFAISAALQYQENTVLGIVYLPVLGELFTAIRGQGAYLNNNKIAVANKKTLQESVLATGFPYDIAENKTNNISYFSQIAPKARGVRRMGSAAIDAAYTAAGRLDGYWEMKLSPWDVAAGILLVEEAGGKVIHFRKDRGISIICSNKTICHEILHEINIVDYAEKA